MSSRAIIRLTLLNRETFTLNYSRRMYAIIRRYTPSAQEGGKNECFAELTGLRTFFKMTYQEIAKKIAGDIKREIGHECTLTVTSPTRYDSLQRKDTKKRSISTYSEINTLFAGKKVSSIQKRALAEVTTALKKRRVRLTVPFIGKVK
jgi:hypothetical protein